MKDGLARVERLVGVLKNHLNLAAQLEAVAPARHLRDAAAVEADFALAGIDQAHDAHGDGRFARARFADQTEDFAALEGKGYAVERVDVAFGAAAQRADQPARNRVELAHRLHREDRLCGHGFALR